MKILCIYGSPRERGNSDILMEEFIKGLEIQGGEVERVYIRSLKILPCNGCGKCIEVCPKDVFVQNENGKVVVVEPFLCIVGCCFCKSACDPEAIMMPKREMLDHYRHGQRKVT